MPFRGANYQPVSKTDHEMFMYKLCNDPAKEKAAGEKAFDFTSIDEYNSIFKYRSGTSLLRQSGSGRLWTMVSPRDHIVDHPKCQFAPCFLFPQ